MGLHLMIGLIGLLYILIFGGMALLRREGLSIRFAVESVILTALAVIFIVFLQVPIHPVLFLLLLYLVTLRVRIFVDLANSFAARGRYAQAEKIYQLASQIGPDPTNKLIVNVNRAIMLLQRGETDQTINLFNEILNPVNRGNLGVKYEAAAHYNLAVAYLRQNNLSKATIEFNSTIDSWPGSLYANRAQQALDRQQHKDSSPVEDKPTGN